MAHINKLTDYALIILSSMKEDEVISALNLSKKNLLPLATTNKILKKLTKYHICGSKKGKEGGYYLLRTKNKISLLSVIQALEDKNPSLTECSTGFCKLKQNCNIQEKMNIIDKEINSILSNKFISDII